MSLRYISSDRFCTLAIAWNRTISVFHKKTHTARWKSSVFQLLSSFASSICVNHFQKCVIGMRVMASILFNYKPEPNKLISNNMALDGDELCAFFSQSSCRKMC